jgi:hypothetical protein
MGARADFIEASMHLFPIPESNIFFRLHFPLYPTPPSYTIFNYARDLPLFHRRAVGGCSPTCQLSRKLWNCTLLHFNIRNCCSINCYIFQDKQPSSWLFIVPRHNFVPPLHPSSNVSPSLSRCTVHPNNCSIVSFSSEFRSDVLLPTRIRYAIRE